MMTLILILGIPLLLLVLWAGWHDYRHRGRGAGAPHDVSGAARHLRAESEGKGSENSL